MTPEAKTLLEAAAAKAGIIDVDAIGLPAFSEAVDKVATAADAQRAVVEMQRLKPTLFPSWDKMGDEEFDRQERRLREGLRAEKKSLELDFDLKAIDAAALSEADFKILDETVQAVTRGDQNTVNFHAGKLKSILARQRGEGAAK